VLGTTILSAPKEKGVRNLFRATDEMILISSVFLRFFAIPATIGPKKVPDTFFLSIFPTVDFSGAFG
jgi:hypothetical protein